MSNNHQQTTIRFLLGLTFFALALITSINAVHAETSGSNLPPFDQCLQERGASAILECKKIASTTGTGTIDVNSDSTDQSLNASNFRFAGTGLATEQLGTPYDVGIGEYEWRGADGCLKFEKTIKKAQFKREDGVISEMPILDADGNPIAGAEKSHGDKCDSDLEFVITGHNRSSAAGSWGNWIDGKRYHSGDIDWISCTRHRSGTAYSYAYVNVKRTTLRDGAVVGTPQTKSCTLSDSKGYTYATTTQSYEGGCGSYWNQSSPDTVTHNPAYPSYPTLSDANKGSCAAQAGWNYEQF